MSIEKLQLNNRYRSFENDIVKEFYIPTLQEATIYKRAVGFFSSSSLIEISRGISGLIKNNGKVKIITSPRLRDEDIDAINKGYKERNKIFEKRITEAIEQPRNYYEKERLNYIANLISNNQLDLKIAFLRDSNSRVAMYHEKIGIILDNQGNKIAFTGSLNESDNSFNNNFESIDVFCSWKLEDKVRVIEKEKDFDDLWDNNTTGVEIIEFPKIAIEKIKEFREDNLISELDLERTEYSRNCKKAEIKVLDENFLYDYQNDAILNWIKNDYKGIFDMATGTGKTFTGLGAITQLYKIKNGKLAVIIVCPYQHLVEQWVEDIVKLNIKPIIGYSASKQKNWKKKLKNTIRNQKLGVESDKFLCFICTNATFSSEFVQNEILKIREETLLVVDEAHNFGSRNLSRLLTDAFDYRLALSATLDRHNDKDGTKALLDFFGNKCIEYPLERAIDEKKLTPYKYYPILVSLTPDELEAYRNLSNQISKCLVRQKDENSSLSEMGKKLAIKRARIVAGAINKLAALKEIIESYTTKNHILVYCGATNILNENNDFTETDEEDLRQIDVVTQILGNELGMRVSQFTSKENMEERKILKENFSLGNNLQALIAIKCLDEGVNIPNIRTAFILASTTNPKEYIQRRGRVLRKSEGKEFAEIYDFITLPRSLNEVPSLTEIELKKEISLVKNELKRLSEFSELAMNSMKSAAIIEELQEKYRLDRIELDFEEAVYD